jgi:hypothetical protein
VASDPARCHPAPGEIPFRLADTLSSSNVVQVLNADGTKPYRLFFTIPAERLEAAPKPEVRFMETAAGLPAAIKTWWYPGERRGYEFILPKEQARRPATAASQLPFVAMIGTATLFSAASLRYWRERRH